MNAELIGLVLQTVIPIVNRHLTAVGAPPLTDADVAAMHAQAIADGKAIINRWFLQHGLTPPD